MRLELCLDQGATRRWHVDLLERLSGQPGLDVGIRWAPAHAEPLPSCVAVLFSLERAVHKLPAGSFALVGPEDLAHHVGQGGVQPDIVLDLTGGHPTAGLRRWRLTFDGADGEVPLIGALLAGRMPRIAILDAETGEPVASGHPGTENLHVIAAALEDVLARTTNLIVAATRPGAAVQGEDAVPADLDCSTVALFGAASIARAALHRLRAMLRQAPRSRRDAAGRRGSGSAPSRPEPRVGEAVVAHSAQAGDRRRAIRP